MLTHRENLEERFQDFFRNFVTERRKHRYMEEMSKLPFSEHASLVIDFSDLQTYDTQLARALAEDPERALQSANQSALDVLRVEYPRLAAKIKKINVRLGGGAGYEIRLREVESDYLHKLVTVNGLLVRVSQVQPLVTQALFECNYCKSRQTVEPRALKMKWPIRCTNPECRTGRKSFTFEPEGSTYEDLQLGRLQENPEELPSGQIPRFMDIWLKGDLVETARPGDPVMVTGILKLNEQQRRKGSSVFDFVTEVNFIESLSKEPSAVTITKEEEEQFKEFASQGDAFKTLVDSFAPSIHGMKEIKESLLLSLFGGTPKVLPDGIKVRGDLHILMVGDPGTAKSELLKYVSQTSPKGLYTSGRGTTAAGLTAAVIKDPIGSFALEAGAVVLGDLGICAIDEIEKMRPDDRVALHEAMEQQTVSIAKGGIVATLNARTTIVSAANPTEGRYNPNRLMKDNINLPVTLLSRFDLIHLIRDEPNRDTDTALVDHVLETRTTEDVFKGKLSRDFMKKYVAYAKRIEPSLSEEAKAKVRDFYLKMRERVSPESPISISPRQLDSIMRLSEARARVDLSETVTTEHAKDATRLLSSFMRQIGADTETGAVDVDIILTGVPQRRRSRPGIIMSTLEALQRELKGPAPLEALVDKVVEQSTLERSDVEEIVENLRREGVIYEPRPGFLAKAG
ncbi:MAG: minichromosome maintenance protein MCM [Candidatus Geothermarchaeales archaeon]